MGTTPEQEVPRVSDVELQVFRAWVQQLDKVQPEDWRRTVHELVHLMEHWSEDPAVPMQVKSALPRVRTLLLSILLVMPDGSIQKALNEERKMYHRWMRQVQAGQQGLRELDRVCAAAPSKAEGLP